MPWFYVQSRQRMTFAELLLLLGGYRLDRCHDNVWRRAVQRGYWRPLEIVIFLRVYAVPVEIRQRRHSSRAPVAGDLEARVTRVFVLCERLRS